MTQVPRFPNFLLLAAIIVDIFTPTLIWKGVLPSNLRWVSEAAIAIMIAVIPLRMLLFNKIPRVFWLVLFLSTVGSATALGLGQDLAATIWGWWVMFQFPLVGLFAYLQPGWPKAFPKYLLLALLSVMVFEVIFQVGQYVTGTPPGDQLGGTFGQNGTGNLVLMLILAVCFAMGELLQDNRKWILLVMALGLGLISSVLGEMKLFYFTLFFVGFLSIILYLTQGKSFLNLIPVIVLVLFATAIFVPVYDAVVPGANELPLEGYFTNTELLTKYLNLKTQQTQGQNYYYDLGRNLAVVYGWDKINANPLYLTLGYGLGARGESTSLGIVGIGLQEGDLGITSGTSALVIIQETGLMGIVILSGFILAVVIGMFRQIKQNPSSEANGLRYGLILFTILFPLWLWYDAAWSSRVAMLLYWSVLGYVASERSRNTAAMQAEAAILRTFPIRHQLLQTKQETTK
jgi:hypothetical protein